MPGKCLFLDDLKFVTFWSEENPEILSKFIEKYPQKDIGEEKTKIIAYLKNKYEKENYNPKEFFGSFYLLFFYLNNNNLENPDEQNISSLLKTRLNKKISQDFIDFFENEGIEFKINKLMNIFLYIEHLCFNEISKNLDEKFKSPMQKYKRDKILSRLKEDKEKNDLSKALRRYIIRYLIGNKNIEKIEKNNLALELNKSDLWGVNSDNLDEIKKFLNDKLSDINLTIFDIYDFYNLIGKQDQEFIEEIIPQKIDEDEENEEEEPFRNKKPKHLGYEEEYEEEKKSDDED